jgi:hypothetical protein
VSADRLDPKALKKVSEQTWVPIRAVFDRLNQVLLSVSPTARGTLITIYIKYAAPETGDRPYAVLWVRKSTELVLGLALPAGTEPPGLTPDPGRYKYANLTRYLTLAAGTTVPAELPAWVALAYETMRTAG